MALNIKKLLVSQPKPASEKSPYFDIAEKYGVEALFISEDGIISMTKGMREYFTEQTK